ncbi:hypothetical protein PPL_11894 [Heterostelium album PN500]|uniref:EGF-like domain-containing protein n=1 Tax=Heterostelium pallidum (strain ATCC 26659 / Pp 5 / PN500) TaxID=670386 RepID=D3BUS2_HETP5|nr:hypothetical protein PPL_11894 [Heterostelium album PN500]EFA74860.1 hypothetical protein PPL_11894 [Heterostelium album PN500]|eukprot:XP_020426994.1 hypothetical protein PPL_11894 [Heterostelium album PN500]
MKLSFYIYLFVFFLIIVNGSYGLTLLKNSVVTDTQFVLNGYNNAEGCYITYSFALSTNDAKKNITFKWDQNGCLDGTQQLLLSVSQSQVIASGACFFPVGTKVYTLSVYDTAGLSYDYKWRSFCNKPQFSPELKSTMMNAYGDMLVTLKVEPGVKYNVGYIFGGSGFNPNCYRFSDIDGYGSSMATLTISLNTYFSCPFTVPFTATLFVNDYAITNISIPAPFSFPYTTNSIKYYGNELNFTMKTPTYDLMRTRIQAKNVDCFFKNFVSLPNDDYVAATRVGNDEYYLINYLNYTSIFGYRVVTIGTNRTQSPEIVYNAKSFYNNAALSITNNFNGQSNTYSWFLIAASISQMSKYSVVMKYNSSVLPDQNLPYPIGFGSGFPTEWKVTYVNISDSESGFLSMTQTYPFGITITHRDLMDGSIYSGLYEKQVFVPNNNKVNVFGFTVKDLAGNSRAYGTNSFLTNYNILPQIPYNVNFTIDNIISFMFLDKRLNVTDRMANSTAYFRLDTPNTQLQPKITFIWARFGDANYNSTFTGFWNSVIQSYQIDFGISMNYISGSIDYIIESNPPVSREILISKFGDVAKLIIDSAKIDYQPPVITNILKFPTGWDITISDPINGLKIAYFNVTSDLDPLPYQYTFTPSDAISGDLNSGVYRINLNGVMCVNQNFSFIDGVKLVDNGGNFAQSFYANQESYFDPFEMYPDVDSANLLYSCDSKPDTTPPSLVVRVDANQPQYISVFVNASDPDSGISSRHNPVVYITGLGDEFIVPMTHIEAYQFYTIYQELIKVPFNFGIERTQFGIGVYGICNNQLNYFASVSIQSFNYTFSNFAVLQGASQISEEGGALTISGAGFGNNSLSITPYVRYSLDSHYVPISSPSFLTFTNAIINIPAFGSNGYAELYFNYSQGYVTNILRIIPSVVQLPTQTPSGTPASCPQSCSGHGDCTPTGCLCNSGWAGPTCSLQLIDVTTNVDSTKPTTTQIDKSNTLNSLISISSIRELDSQGNTVLEFGLNDNWSFENKSTTDTTLYQFSTTLASNRTTRLNVTLQYFEKQSNYSFGNKEYSMSPSSMKYSILIDSYQFKDKLNTLQLVINATLSLSDSDSSCITSDFSDDTQSSEIQYLKLQINGKTLFARFINFGIIDYRIQSLTNKLISPDQQHSGESSTITTSLVGINIPYYESSVLLDPDFSLLVDQDPNKCGQSNSGLSNAKIAGIIVGSVVFGVIIVIAAVLILKRRYVFRFDKGINMVKISK